MTEDREIEELREELQTVKQELAELKNGVSVEPETAESETRDLSRRGFIKTLATGAAGIGMIGAASGFTLRSNSPINLFSSTAQASFDSNGDLNLNGGDITGVTNLVAQNADVSADLRLPSYDDPTSAPQNEGSMIYVTGNGSAAAGVYQHDGSSYSPMTGRQIYVQDTEPSSPSQGDLWVDTS